MAVFRIEKNKNYTSMANYHFYDKTLSWKAKGILSNMLSLPDDWDYSLAGLTTLSSDGMSATRSAIKELEEHRYLIRRPIRKDGKIYDWEYLIFEKPQEEKQFVENLFVENQQVENQTQLNTKELNTKENYISEFETLWKMYPNKKGKDKALGYYQKARKNGTTYEEVEQGIKNYCKEIEVKKTSQQYIKHGSTWFNNKGWLDEYDITSESNQTNQPKQKEFNFIPTGIAESGEEYMEIDGKWFNRYGKELNSKGYEIIDFGLSKGW